MESWKKNLIVCWISTFIICIGISQIAPVLPLYIESLGVSDLKYIQSLSGIIFGSTFFLSAITSPLFGKASDKYGKKAIIVICGFGVGIAIFLMAYVTNVYQLLALRLFQGLFSGFGTACTTLIASETDDAHSGSALGIIAASPIAGNLLGPTIGGYLEITVGIKSIFILTGVLIFISTIICIFFIKENFKPSKEKATSFKSVWKCLPSPFLVFSIFVTTFIIQVALYSIEPIITIYVSQLMGDATNAVLIAGMVFSASGVSTVLISKQLGDLSNKVGAHKVMLTCLLVAAVLFIPQAFVTSPLQLMILRFLLGFAVAGLTPATSILLKNCILKESTGTIFGFNTSANFLGIAMGSFLGGQVSAIFGIRYVFFITSILLIINAIWMYKFTGLFNKNTNLEGQI